MRIKNECTLKLKEMVVAPGTPLLEKAIALDLQESTTCKNFIARMTVILNESAWMQEMTSITHFEDLGNGISPEEREQIDAALKEKERIEKEQAELRAEEERNAAEELRRKKEAEEEERLRAIAAQGDFDAMVALKAKEAAAAAAAEMAAERERETSGASEQAGAKEGGTAEKAGGHKKLVSEMTAQERMMQRNNWKKEAEAKEREHRERKAAKKAARKAEAKDAGAGATEGGKEGDHHRHDGKEKDSGEHWHRPDKKERMENKKKIHKHAEIFRNAAGEVIDGPPDLRTPPTAAAAGTGEAAAIDAATAPPGAKDGK